MISQIKKINSFFHIYIVTKGCAGNSDLVVKVFCKLLKIGKEEFLNRGSFFRIIKQKIGYLKFYKKFIIYLSAELSINM